MRLFGLIGKPLTHSFSKSYFTDKFSREAIDNCRYESFELDQINEITDLIRSHPELNGLNVTIPYKEAVLQFLDYQSEVVRSIGACNCIKIEKGELSGFNTDVFGFRISLEKLLKPAHNKGLILGSGGAAKAVGYVLDQLGISYKVVSRKKEPGQISYEELDEELIEQHKLIVNTTPLGMYPKEDTYPPIPFEFISTAHLLYDLIYNPEQTLFLKKGAMQGAVIKNGYEMLHLQAEESWRIWNS